MQWLSTRGDCAPPGDHRSSLGIFLAVTTRGNGALQPAGSGRGLLFILQCTGQSHATQQGTIPPKMARVLKKTPAIYNKEGSTVDQSNKLSSNFLYWKHNSGLNKTNFVFRKGIKVSTRKGARFTYIRKPLDMLDFSPHPRLASSFPCSSLSCILEN